MNKIQVPFRWDNHHRYDPAIIGVERIAEGAIVIGHSAEDGGAESPITGFSEFNYNTTVAHEVAKHMMQKGILIDLYCRDLWGEFDSMLSMINNLHRAENGPTYQFGISLHHNAFNKKATGTEMYHWHTSKNGELLANCLLEPVVRLFDRPSRGVKAHYKGDRAWSITGRTEPVWCLVEGLFIDNPKDEAALCRNIDMYDEALVEGLCDYMELKGFDV